MIIKENENCFDFLRIYFCLNIVLPHLAGLSQSKSLSFLCYFTNSTIGVQGFFVISGFLVAKSYTNTPSLKQYFLKRAKRILPAYIFVIVFSAIVLSVFSNSSFSNYFSDINVLKYIGWNLVFMNFIHPNLPGLFNNNAVNGALWTLKVEEGFYLILPIIFLLINRIKKPTLILFIIYISSILYWYFMTSVFNKPFLVRQLPGFLSFFSTGIFLYLNINKCMQYKKIIFFIAAILFTGYFFYDFPIYFFAPIAFGFLVITAAFSLKFLNNFGNYGDFTYGLYVFHVPIIQVFKQYNLFDIYNPYLMASLALLLTFAFAVFSWFVIEKRFLDRYKIQTTLTSI